MFRHDVGENSRHGLRLELRNQVTKAVTPPPGFLRKLRLGVELFNDFGRLNRQRGYDAQDHQFGPVIKGYFSDGYYFQTGYRAGISQGAADHLVKLFIGKQF